MTEREPTTEERIRAETSVPMEIRAILGSCPMAELRPLQLTRWVKELITASRQSGINDLKTAEWIRLLLKNDYSRQQINAVMRDFKTGYYDDKRV